MNIGKMFITLLLLICIVSAIVAGIVIYFGIDVSPIFGRRHSSEDQSLGFDGSGKPLPPLENTQPPAENSSLTTQSEVSPVTTQKITSYEEFIGDGYVISFPKDWETEVSPDKRSLVVNPTIDEISTQVSVQVGSTSKTIDEFSKGATELLWKNQNFVICTVTDVGEFPARNIKFISEDRTISGREIVVVDDALGLAYVVMVQSHADNERRYEAVFDDIVSSFKLIEVTPPTPTEALEVNQLFDEAQEGALEVIAD